MSGIGAEREADGQRIAAVIAAVGLHVDHLVDADDLRLERLRDGLLPPPRPRRRDRSSTPCTCGGTMSGNCATGMRSSASTPASVMTIAMTIASRGRSTKTAEIMARLPLRRAGRRPGWRRRPGAGLTTGMPGRTRWMPSTITVSPSFSPPAIDGGGRRRLAERDAALLHLVVARRRRRRSRPAGRTARRRAEWPAPCTGSTPSSRTVTNSPSISGAVDRLARLRRPARRVGDRARAAGRVGVVGDRWVDVVELAGLLVQRAVRQPQPDHHGARSRPCRRSACAAPAPCAPTTGNRTYIGSWLTIVASGPELGETTLPTVTAVRPILPAIGARISV